MSEPKRPAISPESAPTIIGTTFPEPFRSRIGDRVKFVGFVPRAEVDRYYAAADLFVFASFTETQGLVVQEALTYGLPAVAIVGGGAGEAIEEGVNGFLVKNDPHAVASACTRILSDDLLASRFSEAAERTVRLNGAAEMCDKVVEVYRQVVDSRGTRHSEVAGIASVH